MKKKNNDAPPAADQGLFGKILTAVAGPKYENKVMELLSYEEKK